MANLVTGESLFVDSTLELVGMMRTRAKEGHFEMDMPRDAHMEIMGVDARDGKLSWVELTGMPFGDALYCHALNHLKSTISQKMREASLNGQFHLHLDAPLNAVHKLELDKGVTIGKDGASRVHLSWGRHVFSDQQDPSYRTVRYTVDSGDGMEWLPVIDDFGVQCVRITSIDSDGPMRYMDLQENDLITGVDGRDLDPLDPLKSMQKLEKGVCHTMAVRLMNRRVPVINRCSVLSTIDPFIGMSVAMDGSKLTVRHTIPGGAADLAGLRTGDVITSIGGESAIGMSQEDVVAKINQRMGRLTITHRSLDIPDQVLIDKADPGLQPKSRRVTVRRKGSVDNFSFGRCQEGLRITRIDSGFVQGLYPGDVIVSFNGIQASEENLTALKESVDPLLVVDLALFNHRKEVITRTVKIDRSDSPKFGLHITSEMNDNGNLHLASKVSLVTVTRVAPLFPAHRAGIRVGDLIMAVDAVSVLTMGHDEICSRIVDGTSSTSLTLTMIDVDDQEPHCQ